MIQLTDRITMDPMVMLGKPVIRGTRITVEIVLKRLSEGATIESILQSYPHLCREDILGVLDYAHKIVTQRAVAASGATEQNQ